jgi:hypothetical protein
MTTTIAWNKNLRSMRHTVGIAPNGWTVEWSYRCWATSTTNSVVTPHAWNPFDDQGTAIPGLQLPMPGDRVQAPTGNGPYSWQVYTRVRELVWSSVDESLNAWDVTVTASGKDQFCGEPNIWRTDSTTTRKIDLYRDHTPAYADSDGTAVVAAGEDVNISGRPLDQKTISQIQISVQMLWNTGDPQAPGYPVIVGAEPYLNRRNSEEFLEFPKGTVLFTGVDVDQDQDEYIKVTYTFLYDSWFHLTQEPLRGLDGQPILKTNVNTNPAKDVLWSQPFPEEVELNDLLDETTTSWLTLGWSYAPECGETPAVRTGASTAGPIYTLGEAEAGVRPVPEAEEVEPQPEPEPPPAETEE